MKWRKIIRSSGLIEYVCEHGVGHPDYESAINIGENFGIHGCCEEMCCSREDFPGKKKNK